jgi:hypothetical protein
MFVEPAPFGHVGPLVFSTSQTHAAESPRPMARLFAGCLLRLIWSEQVQIERSQFKTPSSLLPISAADHFLS